MNKSRSATQMMQKRMMTVAAGAVLALGISACAGGTTSTTPTAAGGTADAANAAVNKVLRPSTTKGGTLRFGMPGDWDSVDPGDTYYALSWNFLRNYARTLVVFKSAPGAAGAKLVPDLALTRGEQAFQTARTTGDRRIEFLAAGGIALEHLELGDAEAADTWLDRAAAAAAAAPTPHRAWQLEEWRARAAASRGDLGGRRDHFDRAAGALGLAKPATFAIVVIELEAVARTQFDHRIVRAHAVAVVALEAIAAR